MKVRALILRSMTLPIMALLFMTLLLGACGWQLQGARRVPERLLPLYLDLKDEHSAFARILTQRLHSAGIAVASDRSQALTVLSVTADRSGHHVSSVSALNEPQQYEVFYNIEYQLDALKPDAVDPEPATLLPSQAVTISRTMSYDKRLALAKQREELVLKETLAEEIVDQVLRRLSMPPQAMISDAMPVP